MGATTTTTASRSSRMDGSRGQRARLALLFLGVMALLQLCAVQAFLPSAPCRLVHPRSHKDTSPPLARPRHPHARWVATATADATSGGNDDDDGSGSSSSQERAITLHTLELPVLEDPSGYRGVLQARFPGATLLRWHLSEVVERAGVEGGRVALAEVVVVERRAGAGGAGGGGEA